MSHEVFAPFSVLSYDKTMTLIFNEAYYLSQNPDVDQAVKAGLIGSGYEHWQQYGKEEGRKASAVFDWQVYRDLNPDLAAAGLLTEVQLTRHFSLYGASENRPFVSSSIFSATYYAKLNPDLASAGIDTPVELMQHFQQYGLFEGRAAHPFVNGETYLNANLDVKNFIDILGFVFHQSFDTVAAGLRHYYLYGLNESRSTGDERNFSASLPIDTDNSHGYSAGDALTIKFKTPVMPSTLTIADLAVSNEHSLGAGAFVVPVNLSKGYATEFKIVLGSGTNLSTSDMITVPEGGFLYQGNTPSGRTEVFDVPKIDTVAPAVVSATYQDLNGDGKCNSFENVVIKFSEPVNTSLKATDFLARSNLFAFRFQTITPVDPHAGFASEFVLTLPKNKSISGNMIITVDKGVVIDMLGNMSSASMSTSLSKYVVPNPVPESDSGGSADTTAPTLTSSAPSDDGINVAVAANIVLNFSENVVAGVGDIVIQDAASSDVRTISINAPDPDGTITIVGNVLTINPTFDLLPNETYNVQMAPGVVVDTAGNSYVGISNTTTLNFDTVALDLIPPVASSFVMTSTTVGATSNEAGTLGLYNGAALVGSTGTFTDPLGLTQTISPAAQLVRTMLTLKVADAASNFAVATHDVILGTIFGDSILGGAGEEFIFGFAGNDTIEGGLGIDSLSGGAGSDSFYFNTTIGSPSDSTLSTGFDSILDMEASDSILVQLYGVNIFDASSANYVVTNRATSQNLLIFNTVGDGGDGSGSSSTICIGIGTYNRAAAASQAWYNMEGTAGADNFTGGGYGDTFSGFAGADQIHGGGGDDLILLTSTLDDAIGEVYDGGTHAAGDTLRVTGATTVDFSNDTITGIEILDLGSSIASQTVTLLASQLAGFTGASSADASDIINVKTMQGGVMSASGGSDRFVWGAADSGLNKIGSFSGPADILKFDFVLKDGATGAAITAVDLNNDINAGTIIGQAGGMSFNMAGKGVYVYAVSIGGTDGTAYGGTNGINLGSATEANILANVQAALEYTGGWNALAGALFAPVTQGAVGTDVVFLLDDGGGNNTAVLRYRENDGDASFTGELALLGVITGHTAGDFIWGAEAASFYA